MNGMSIDLHTQLVLSTESLCGVLHDSDTCGRRRTLSTPHTIVRIRATKALCVYALLFELSRLTLSLIRSYDELRKYRKIRAVSGARDDNKEKVSYFSGIAQTLRQCELVRKSN